MNRRETILAKVTSGDDRVWIDREPPEVTAIVEVDAVGAELRVKTKRRLHGTTDPWVTEDWVFIAPETRGELQ